MMEAESKSFASMMKQQSSSAAGGSRSSDSTSIMNVSSTKISDLTTDIASNEMNYDSKYLQKIPRLIYWKREKRTRGRLSKEKKPKISCKKPRNWLQCSTSIIWAVRLVSTPYTWDWKWLKSERRKRCKYGIERKIKWMSANENLMLWLSWSNRPERQEEQSFIAVTSTVEETTDDVTAVINDTGATINALNINAV